MTLPGVHSHASNQPFWGWKSGGSPAEGCQCGWHVHSDQDPRTTSARFLRKWRTGLAEHVHPWSPWGGPGHHILQIYLQGGQGGEEKVSEALGGGWVLVVLDDVESEGSSAAHGSLHVGHVITPILGSVRSVLLGSAHKHGRDLAYLRLSWS